MADRYTFNVSVLLYQEANGQHSTWIAQCIDYDIAAYGPSIEDAKRSFERTFAAQIAVDLREGLEPLQNVPAAPREFLTEFVKADPSVDPMPLRLPETVPGIIRAMANDLRIGQSQSAGYALA